MPEGRESFNLEQPPQEQLFDVMSVRCSSYAEEFSPLQEQLESAHVFLSNGVEHRTRQPR